MVVLVGVVMEVGVLGVVACDHGEFGAVVLCSTRRKVRNRNHPAMDRVLDSF
jgi:hypothetical protein